MSTTPETAAPLVEVKNIEVISNRVILVLKGVSLALREGGIIALLGGNGAGKTTTLKAISNLLRSERGEVTRGEIRFAGARVDGLSPARLVRSGVIQVMEGRHCFEHLTIEENLLTGAYTRTDSSAALAADLEKVYAYFPRLKERRRSQAGYTSGGEQQMTARGRALMAKPSMILLDEPSMGLAPQLVEEIFEIVKRPERIRVRALDRDGRPVALEAEGLLSVCIQHEVDHLEGRRFVDYLSRLKRQRIRKKAEKALQHA